MPSATCYQKASKGACALTFTDIKCLAKKMEVVRAMLRHVSARPTSEIHVNTVFIDLEKCLGEFMLQIKNMKTTIRAMRTAPSQVRNAWIHYARVCSITNITWHTQNFIISPNIGVEESGATRRY